MGSFIGSAWVADCVEIGSEPRMVGCEVLGARLPRTRPLRRTVGGGIGQRRRAFRQRLFLLDGLAYRRFTAALDAPPTENPRLRRLLRTRAPWER